MEMTIRPLRIASTIFGGALAFFYAKKQGATGGKLILATGLGAGVGYVSMWAGETVYGLIGGIGAKMIDKAIK